MSVQNNSPFFSKCLSGQARCGNGGPMMTTMKAPSDSDEDAGNRPPICTKPPVSKPIDLGLGATTMKYPSDGDDDTGNKPPICIKPPVSQPTNPLQMMLKMMMMMMQMMMRMMGLGQSQGSSQGGGNNLLDKLMTESANRGTADLLHGNRLNKEMESFAGGI